MLFVIVLILATITSILFFFYKQAIKEFRILQTNSLDKVLPLMQERCPLVLHPSPTPMNLWTQKDIEQRPILKQRVEKYLNKSSTWIEPKEANEIATQVGLPIWVNQNILPPLKNIWWGQLLWTQTKITIGAQGLRPTFGFITIIMATEGALQVSLLNESSDPYLPKQWLGKRLSKLTKDDAPLLNQIQYVDVILRHGSALIIPPHWKICWENLDTKSALGLWIDIHHPISFIAQQAFYRKS
jgi:hypothetical protein